MSVKAPQQGEDFRTLHRYVSDLVKGTNSLLNMTALMEGRAHGIGELRLYAGVAELRIHTGSEGQDVGGGQNKQHTVCNIASSVNPSEFGQLVFWACGVATDATGTVIFYIDGLQWGAPVTVVGGLAFSLSRANLQTGTHYVIAHYSGDARYFDEWSNVLVQRVNALQPLLIQVEAFPNPADEGISLVTFVVAVTGQSPIPPAPNITGSIRFFIDGAFFMDGTLHHLSGDTWITDTEDNPINYLEAGDHEIIALYLGDNNYGQVSDSVTLRVRRSSEPELSINPNPVRESENVRFTALIGHVGGPIPTGTVTLLIDGVPYGPPKNLVNGTALWDRDDLVMDTYSCRIQYSGDTNYVGGFSPFVTLTVTNNFAFTIQNAFFAWSFVFASGIGRVCENEVSIFPALGGPNQNVRIVLLQSHHTLYNIQSQPYFNGPLTIGWRLNNQYVPNFFQLTPCEVDFVLIPHDDFWAACAGWALLGIQLQNGQIAGQVFVVGDGTGHWYAEGQYIAGNLGQTPP